ncbi:MAG: serine/threonine-protein kinase [Jatrophihabitans sp.]
MGERTLPAEYVYERALGAGAFGDVVLARQRSLSRMVAIKRIHRHVLTDADAIARFRREGQVLAGLRDPAIVRVYDFSTGEDTPGADALLVMEFVAGSPFDELIANHCLTTPQALGVLEDVARALTVAASAGVVHRDVKPSNVFVLDDGHAKLGDFGLARVLTDPSMFRTAGEIVGGTPAYFAPEVSQGGQPDTRSDAYSFAVMAYEALVGRRPIQADSPLALITAHWTQQPPQPEAIVPGFPVAAGNALMQGLDKRPEWRILPAELVRRLRSVPATDWPAVRPEVQPRVHDSQRDRDDDDTTMLGPASPGLAGPPVFIPRPATAPGPPRRRRRGLLVAVASGLAVIAAVTIVLVTRSDPVPPAKLTLASVAIAVAPANAVGHCPGALFDFVARILTNGSSGTLTADWSLPGGKQFDAGPIVVAQGRREVKVGVHFPVSGQQALRGRATVRVVAPGGVITAQSAEVSYTCAPVR